MQKIVVDENYKPIVYGYIRVSTDLQTVENQRFEINNYCTKHGLKIDKWIEETISGTKDYKKRLLGKCLLKMNKGDEIICSELSRLGRNLLMIMEILNKLLEKGCIVQTIKDNYRLGDDIQSKVLAFAFDLSAEIERNLISQRTKEALKRLKAEGKVLGRPKGRKTTHPILEGKLEYIESKEALNWSHNKIAKKLHVNRNTLSHYLINVRGTSKSPYKQSLPMIDYVEDEEPIQEEEDL